MLGLLLFVWTLALFKTSLAKAADADYFTMRSGDERKIACKEVLSGYVTKRSLVTLKYGETVVANGREYVRQYCDSYSATRLIRVDDTGVYSISEEPSQPNSPDNDRETCDFLFPLEVGKRCGKYFVLNKLTMVFNGKTYKNCLHLSGWFDDGYVQHIWLAPGLGEIGSLIIVAKVGFRLKMSSHLIEFNSGAEIIR